MSPPGSRRARPRRDLGTMLRYGAWLLREFRATLWGLALCLALGTVLYALTPHASHGGRPPPLGLCLLATWLALFGQQMLNPPETWYLALMLAVYPLFGFGLIGEGVVRLGMLMISKKHGEEEWMIVQASTYRNHIVLCGLGHLGFRTLLELHRSGAQVVALEKEAEGRFVGEARALGVPILIRDMREDQALIDAGITHARVVIVTSNDDLANLEVALDSRRLNPDIRVLMRMFDQRIADKFKDAQLIDEAFSASALAAPVVSQMALRTAWPGKSD